MSKDAQPQAVKWRGRLTPRHHDWAAIERDPEFRSLIADKIAFIVPATLFFVVYYFALPVSVGYFPEFMSKKVWGQLNLAYLFALSQFFMAWGLAWLYTRKAAGYDARAHELVGHLMHIEHPEPAMHADHSHDPSHAKRTKAVRKPVKRPARAAKKGGKR